MVGGEFGDGDALAGSNLGEKAMDAHLSRRVYLSIVLQMSKSPVVLQGSCEFIWK